MQRPTILILDDEENLRRLMAQILELEDFEVLQAATWKAALKRLETHSIDVILCDVKLPDSENGVELTRIIKLHYPQIEVIVLTAFGNISDGVLAIKNGAFDYITKGDDNDKIVPLVYRALEKIHLARRIQQLENQVDKKYSFDNILGASSAIQSVINLARKVAPTGTTVLLLGETGTGKEVFARAIHQASTRSTKPFVAINCSAFSKDMLESEMFGHKAGAFTGAIRDKKGLFEEANHGTIFLDEVGEMSAELQAKVLRVLESGEYFKVGDSKPSTTNVRVIAATNRSLEQEVATGNFRADLFYRLSVFQITLPSLIDRIEDIAPLARHFTALFAAKMNKKITTMSDNYLKILQHHAWKGNIRELKNVIERSVILADTGELTSQTLPFEMQHSTPISESSDRLDLATTEKFHIHKVLHLTKGNKTETARLLGIALTTLYRKLEEYGI
ncbi:MAG: sigma-54-dependent Fis family transcriptional regulator [Ignavibacteria bacterium]|nr:sigma-54-dependent Fis family transcriptional regulator [Ignavibacteria bacterium]